ncbi:MAG: ribosome-associated translation inhibitor RaiA [Clostridia bacterium]|nr:ribosome-associated translation inhibitor RaiA [Clostridia bacterium]MEE1025261.1 ribosome-associated translation inhibitor RaiA [Acutalibacteraceae bacterium]
MKTTYTVKKMTIKPSTQDHIEKKLQKLDKFFSDNADASVMLRLERDRVTVEITIRDNGLVYRAEDEQIDLLDAFDDAYDNIVRRIRKQKTKLEKRIKSAALVEFDIPLDDEPKDFDIVKSKKFTMKPLSVQEAILQMNLIGHKFYMFHNQDTDSINVVYERNDGRYGLIEPE